MIHRTNSPFQIYQDKFWIPNLEYQHKNIKSHKGNPMVKLYTSFVIYSSVQSNPGELGQNFQKKPKPTEVVDP